MNSSNNSSTMLVVFGIISTFILLHLKWNHWGTSVKMHHYRTTRKQLFGDKSCNRWFPSHPSLLCGITYKSDFLSHGNNCAAVLCYCQQLNRHLWSCYWFSLWSTVRVYTWSVTAQVKEYNSTVSEKPAPGGDAGLVFLCHSLLCEGIWCSVFHVSSSEH